MSEAIVQELGPLQNDGTVVYDALLDKDVLVIVPLICLIADNPRAAELLNHLGATAKRYCRMCMVNLEYYYGCCLG